jgi:hypothetical protein
LTGPTGPVGSVSGLTLNGLADVITTLDGGPVHGQILRYNGITGAQRWENDTWALLDFIELTPNDDVFRIRVNNTNKVATGGFSLANIPNATDRTYFLPNASGTVALENRFTTFNQGGQSVNLTDPQAPFGVVLATCPTVDGIQSKAIGGSFFAFPQGVMLLSSLIQADGITVRTEVQATIFPTTVQAVAYCMKMP